MTKLRFAIDCEEPFKQISSKRLQTRLDSLLDLLVEVPTFALRFVRSSLRREFGDGCLKIDLDPRLLYEYDEEDDIVHVYGIVHAHSAR